ncbi:unnamed protein product [Danaus chrysippus]|uniref:(African queen) hypothetical protein n=1 Tax=Danaus chrysippus TaxID=151541 RepID=A0A8J2QTW7_9NEOP|nr:unnamed protein product [Danaus chrysippus]
MKSNYLKFLNIGEVNHQAISSFGRIKWENIRCSSDRELAVPEGKLMDIGRFSWDWSRPTYILSRRQNKICSDECSVGASKVCDWVRRRIYPGLKPDKLA